ncbi:PAS domain S-box protein [Methanosarcina sp. MSH10X1]|uniref:MASE3 domain-containing protein n=1 Tax=Methanosarcina sp. MSH10X1 TaxID=2507075 RepID=UPI000FFC1291|nr:MASE3 domain-containing protein [Methanosarcina sp. MSH10X1]RXA20564.1 PAS domain S-box protein [Methanosarcina sp. MSH10X1]
MHISNIWGRVISFEHSGIIFWVVMIGLLHILGLSNSLLSHTLIELFSIIVAYVIFLLAWESKTFLENRYILFLGIAYFFVGTLDLLHTLSYENMGMFPGFDTDLPAQFWIVARYMESVSFLIAPLLLINHGTDNVRAYLKPVEKSMFAWRAFSAYAIITLICILSIFVFGNFPDSYIEGSGPTSFDIVSKYIISLILFCSLVLLYLKRDFFENRIFKLLAASIVLTIFSEMTLTTYTSVNDFSFALGHYFKFLSFYLVYKAIVEMGFGEPYSFLFRELKYSEEDFRQKAALLWEEYNRMCGMIGINKCLTGGPEKLEKNEEDYYSFIQNLHAIGFQFDGNLSVIFLHGPVEEMTGYTRQDFLSGKIDWEEIIIPDDRSIIFENIKKLRSNPASVIESEYRIRTRNGELKWVRQFIRRIPDESRTSAKFQCSVHDITQYKITEEALKKIEITRIKEIHHRIKNNLQVISSLLSLQAEKFEDREVLEAFRESQNRVASIAIIHEELHEGNSLDILNFSDYLRKLTADLFSSYQVGGNGINLKLELEQVNLGMDTAIPLGIIVNELVSNALKHAFPAGNKGEINIRLQETEKYISEFGRPVEGTGCQFEQKSDYVLAVADNGRGIPEEIDFKITDSLGLQLVNILVEQIDGCIELKRAEGTEFIIWFNSSGK